MKHAGYFILTLDAKKTATITVMGALVVAEIMKPKMKKEIFFGGILPYLSQRIFDYKHNSTVKKLAKWVEEQTMKEFK